MEKGRKKPDNPSNAQSEASQRTEAITEDHQDFPYPDLTFGRIRQLYRVLEERLLPAPLVDDLRFHVNYDFPSLQIVSKEKTRGVLTDNINNMTAIFKTQAECEKPRTVLIEGDPGFGKTIYCQKLAYDWAIKHEETDSSFPKIDVLLLLKCRDIESSIWEAIDDQIFPEGVDDQEKECFFRFIRENQSKVLLVLDGLDEADPSYFKTYFDLFEGKELPNCYIVLTSRPGTGRKMRSYFDTVWEIVVSIKEYVRRYFGRVNQEHLADKVTKFISESAELSEWAKKHPLYATLICFLWEHFDGVFPANKTLLYMEFVRFFLRRYESKQGLSHKAEEDLLSIYKKPLLHLGRIALQALWKANLSFLESEFNDSFTVISKLEFLSFRPSGSMIRPRVYCTFLLKSFQEFFSGLYLAWQVIDGEVDWDSIVTHQRYCSDLYPVLLSAAEYLATLGKINPEFLEKVSLPSYVAAREPRAVAAFMAAKAFGSTLDKRVKVMLIGQDQVGKTSVARSLNGELFTANEPSTNGVQMHTPKKNPGNQPWKNYAMQHVTTAYHQKCADYISKEVQSMSQGTESPRSSNLDVGSDSKQKTSPSVEEESQANSNSTQKDSPSGLFYQNRPDPNEEEVTACSSSHSSQDKKQERENPFTNEPVAIDGKVADLYAEKLHRKEVDNPDGIWPVIWDFAGQALYRAIHPIFMSSEAVYVLVWDPTNDLFATAQCKVNKDGRGEVEVETADSSDTNLDHILRWLDMVHALRPSNDNCELPPVILVATHVGETGCSNDKIKVLETFLRTNCKEFYKHIVTGKSMIIDNTLAGTQIQGEEDRHIVELRDKILEVARKLRHTQIDVPLKWLEVENKVFDHAKQEKEKYMTKQRFKSEIVSKIAQPYLDHDLEHILNFMHDRGAVVYLANPENQDGLIVLDPQWLVNDVLCKIITVTDQEDDDAQIKLHRGTLQVDGILHPALLNYACKNLKLDDIKNDLIFLMKKFNLLCEYKEDASGESVYLVPCMLTREPKEHLECEALPGCEPVFITFDTSYVPFGLFSRILVLFSEWAASRTSCERTKLDANAASFVVTKESYLSVAFVCYKTVIKIPILEWDPSKSTQCEREVLSEVSSVLTQILERIKQECHWLRGVSWKLCGQCKLCIGGRDKTKMCFWHKKPECSLEDCTHYVSIRNKPFACQNRKKKLSSSRRIPQTWIQVLETGLEDITWPCASSRSSECLKVKKGTPSDDELEGLSQRIPEDWKKLGRRLIHDEARLTTFDLENPSCSEKAYKMLLFWKQSEGGKDASYQVLFDALCDKLVQLKELAKEFCCD